MANITYADLTDLVFEGRNHKYGGYVLRKAQWKYILLSVAIVSVVFTLGTTGPNIFNSIFGAKTDSEEFKKVNVSLSMHELPPPPPMDETAPPPPPPEKMPPKPNVKTVAFKIPEPVPEDELPDETEESTIVEMDSLKEAPNIGLKNIEGEDRMLNMDEINLLEEKTEEPEVIREAPKKEPVPDINAFIFVQEEPVPINLEEIKEKIGYPALARDADIEGIVVVRVLVDEYGNYHNHKVIKQAHPILGNAVKEHIRALKFTPAIQGGQSIKFWVNVPFRFTLIK